MYRFEPGRDLATLLRFVFGCRTKTNFSKYRDTYRIATQVSRYVSYHECTVSLQP